MNKDSNALRDIVIGMSDGLTVTFALVAGLTGALVSTKIILIAGLVQIVAGSIAMGLGGYYAKNEMKEVRAGNSGLLIGIGYVVGGLIALASYFFTEDTLTGLKYSAVITIVSLFILGYYKSKFTGANSIVGALRTTVIGVIAAACAYGIAKLIIGI